MLACLSATDCTLPTRTHKRAYARPGWVWAELVLWWHAGVGNLGQGRIWGSIQGSQVGLTRWCWCWVWVCGRGWGREAGVGAEAVKDAPAITAWPCA